MGTIGWMRWTGRLSFAAAALIAGCNSSERGDPSGKTPANTPRQEGTAGLVQRFLEEEVTGKAEGYSDAAQRFVMATMLGSADGVSLTGPVMSQQGTIAADLDEDGSREASLSVMLMPSTPEMMSPRRFTFGNAAGPGAPILSFTGIMALMDATVTVTEGGGSFETDYVRGYLRNGSGEVGPMRVAGASVATMELDAFDADYQNGVTGTCTLQVAPEGSRYRIKVVINDNVETPANEAAEFMVN